MCCVFMSLLLFASGTLEEILLFWPKGLWVVIHSNSSVLELVVSKQPVHTSTALQDPQEQVSLYPDA